MKRLTEENEAQYETIQELNRQLAVRPPRKGFLEEFREWRSRNRHKRRRGFFRWCSDHWIPIMFGFIAVSIVASFIVFVDWNHSLKEGVVVSRKYVPERTTTRWDSNTKTTRVEHHDEEYNVRVCDEYTCQTFDRADWFGPEWRPGTYHCIYPPCDGLTDNGN